MFAHRSDTFRGTRTAQLTTRRLLTERLEDRRLMSGVAYADFDGDGLVDAADYVVFKRAVDVRLGNGDGTFGAAQSVSLDDVPGRIDHVATGDFNADGRPDLLTAGTYGRGATTQGIIAILIGLTASPTDGRVEFGEALITETTVPAVQGEPVVGDWNGDGRDDLGVARRSGIIAILIGVVSPGGDLEGLEQRGVVRLDESIETGVAAGDLNGDGRDDLAYVGGADRSLHVVANRGNGVWDDTDIVHLINLTDVLVSSITDNGTEDLVVIRNGSAHVFEGDPQRLLGLHVDTSPIDLSVRSAASAVLADVDGDGHTDLFSPVPKKEPVVAYGDGTGAFTR